MIIKRIILSLTSLCLCAVSSPSQPLLTALAQGDKKTSEEIERSVAARKDRKLKYTVIEYDKFKDTTFVRVKPMSIGSFTFQAITGGLEISAMFSSKGQKITKPETIALKIISVSNAFKHVDERARKLIVLVDGQQFDLGAMQMENMGRGASFSRYSGDLVEEMSVSVSQEDFAKIANAKKVEMQLGSKDFSLKDKHLDALRELLGLTSEN
ncbi:MAG: hypothetical protein L0220_22215 [Acidobacteria bacterium]|nr:hypothetical protein [Acidobacteriota bacterium]